jgi:hypothetical protein
VPGVSRTNGPGAGDRTVPGPPTCGRFSSGRVFGGHSAGSEGFDVRALAGFQFRRGIAAEKSGICAGTKNNVHFVTLAAERFPGLPHIHAGLATGDKQSGRQAIRKASSNHPSQIRPDNIGSESGGSAGRKGRRSQGAGGACARPKPSRAGCRTNAAGLAAKINIGRNRPAGALAKCKPLIDCGRHPL